MTPPEGARTRPTRIDQPWGERTAYGPGEDWPVRVDTHLADGVREEDVDRWVQTASILHSNGDALDIAVVDGRIQGVRGRATDRVNHGRLGVKDLYGWQANSSPDRLTRPLIRENGRLVETDWDTAMNRVVGRTRELLDEQGASAIGFYTSGQLFAEEYYTLGVIAHGGIGTNHVDGNTRLCTATAAAPASTTAVANSTAFSVSGSTPRRILTVISTPRSLTASTMARTMRCARSGSAMRPEPSSLLNTLGTGHPAFRSMKASPSPNISATRRACRPSTSGSEPNSWTALGRSPG